MAGLVAVIAAIAVPQSLVTVDRLRARAATRYLAARLALARAQAVKRSAYVALRFDETTSGTSFGTFVDGNRNGVLTRDIAARVDLPLESPVPLPDLFPGVTVALSDESNGSEQTGSTRLLSFSPLGTATSASIFVRGRDGSQLAVRVLGVTGRVRAQRYVTRTRQWTDF